MLLVGQQEEHMACKNRVVGRTCCLSGARRRLAYGPADATATHCLLYRLTRVVLDKGPINGCVCTLYTTQYFTGQMPFLSPNQQSQSTEGRCWVVGCWHGYLSGVRCRLAYGPADATATHCLLLQQNPDWFYLSGTDSPG